MPRRTKEQLMIAKREKLLDDIVLSNRYLREPKYYKNNYWSMAAWDSWAAQGKAGSCRCGVGHYNASLCNTRRHTKRGGGIEHCKHVMESFCYDCVSGITKRLKIEFRKRH